MTGFEADSLDVLVDTRDETVTSLLQAAIGALNLVRGDAVLIAAARGIPGCWIMEVGGVPAERSVCPAWSTRDAPAQPGLIRLT
ncbi:hypothetical protein Ait01nite_047020 [Actinoplanes italicus]|uniref:Uncharacterized protein n=1 Tax=Actinoplanes italicus TaxID=113567 RepID=A0A2T0KA16_9ACTN|nr:hypothetical protein [Actinoplanes italicus]PRX19806.1 hypothetical protein CLV67_10971 [Actinoplanes italicus]GIE31657.1 hypothetical protein Ait01nite_047020 [Actinoplanes italicus]